MVFFFGCWYDAGEWKGDGEKAVETIMYLYIKDVLSVPVCGDISVVFGCSFSV